MVFLKVAMHECTFNVRPDQNERKIKIKIQNINNHK